MACESRLSQHFVSVCGPVWLFGFGSLLWKMEGSYTRAEHAVLPGYMRRFYQASPDHRGTPESQGRVATLVPALRERARFSAAPFACPMVRAAVLQWLSEGAPGGGEEEGSEAALEGEDPATQGIAYLLEGATAAEHLSKLCKREAGGYTAKAVRVVLKGGETVQASCFTGEVGGEFWAPGPPQALAEIISCSAGCSGTNLDYLLKCKDALSALGVTDVALNALVALALEYASR